MTGRIIRGDRIDMLSNMRSDSIDCAATPPHRDGKNTMPPAEAAAVRGALTASVRRPRQAPGATDAPPSLTPMALDPLRWILSARGTAHYVERPGELACNSPYMLETRAYDPRDCRRVCKKCRAACDSGWLTRPGWYRSSATRRNTRNPMVAHYRDADGRNLCHARRLTSLRPESVATTRCAKCLAARGSGA